MPLCSVRRILDALNTLLRTDSKSHNIGAAEVFGRLIIKEDNEHHLISYGQKVRTFYAHATAVLQVWLWWTPTLSSM